MSPILVVVVIVYIVHSSSIGCTTYSVLHLLLLSYWFHLLCVSAHCAIPSGDCGLFADFAAGLLRDSSVHDVILVDMVYYPFVSRASLFADLRKHIFCNIFKVVYAVCNEQ